MEYLTTKQAGKILDVNDSRVRQFILEGRLPTKKFGAVWMIKEKDLEKVKNRIIGRPKKYSQARHPEPKSGYPDRSPVGKPSRGK